MTVYAYPTGYPGLMRLLAPSRVAPGRLVDAAIGREALNRLQRGRCYLCCEPWGSKRTPLAMTDEHVVPQSKGGLTAGNKLLAHARCNEAKGSRWPYPCELIYLAAVNASWAGVSS